jgi:UDP-glucose 4-epimerase
VIARLFNVYGQCETNPHVIPDLLGRLNGTAEAVVELGNVWPLRDYVHVSDVVRALRLLADGAAGLEVCNIAGGAGHTVADLVAEIGRATGHDIEIRHDPSRARKSDGHLVADLVRIGQQYGWKPSHNLRSGLDDLVGNPHGHSTAELIGG